MKHFIKTKIQLFITLFIYKQLNKPSILKIIMAKYH